MKIGKIVIILLLFVFLNISCQNEVEICKYVINDNGIMTVTIDNKYSYEFDYIYIERNKSLSAYEMYVSACPSYIGTIDDWYDDIINQRFGCDGLAYYKVTFFNEDSSIYKINLHARESNIDYIVASSQIDKKFEYWTYNNNKFDFNQKVLNDIDLYPVYSNIEHCDYEIDETGIMSVIINDIKYWINDIKFIDVNNSTAYDIYRNTVKNYVGTIDEWHQDIINNRLSKDGLVYYNVIFYDKDNYEFLTYKYPRGEKVEFEEELPEKDLKFISWMYNNEQFNFDIIVTSDMNIYPLYQESHNVSIVFDDKFGAVKNKKNKAFDGDILNLEYLPFFGYDVKKVYLNDIEVEKDCLIMLNEDVVIKVEFGRKYLELPIININLDCSLDQLTKDDYVEAMLSIENAGQYNLEETFANIKGRGNWSWFNDKKPFRIKFDKKQDLFGNGKSKHWVLLANYCDLSLSRNDIAMKTSTLFDGIEYTSSSVDVEVYLNDEYIGVYSLCEKIRVDEDRVNINSEYNIVDTGYLLEYDAYAKGMNKYNGIPGTDGIEGITYFKVEGMKYWFSVHSPDPDDYLINSDTEKYRAQIAFIQDYMIKSFEAMKSNDFNKINDYIDVSSFVDMYILNELFKNTDVGWSSFYMCKKKSGKLYCTALWDYEFSSGLNRGDNTFSNLYAAVEFDRNLSTLTSNEMFIDLMKNNEFKELVVERWEQLNTKVKNLINNEIDNKMNLINSMNRNFQKWNLFGQKMLCEEDKVVNFTSWEQHIMYLQQWLNSRIDWLNKYWL